MWEASISSTRAAPCANWARRAMHDVQDLERGELRLATTPTFTAYLVGPLLAAFQAKYPGVTVRLKEMSPDTIAAAVAADEVDLGIAFKVTRTLPSRLKRTRSVH